MMRASVRRVLGRNGMLVLGLGIVLFMSLAALGAPWLAPYPPDAEHLDHVLEAPSVHFWLGTDRLGRDILSRLLYGGRVSLWVGFVAVGISVSIGTTLGLVSGYFRRWVDETVMRLVDIMLCFPSFFLILAVIAFLEPSLTNIMIVIGLTPEWGGASCGDFHAADLAAPYPPQCARAGADHRHTWHCGRHSCGVGPEFSRAWRAAAHAKLGQYAHGGKGRH